MFDGLGSRLETALGRIRGKARLSAADVDLALGEIRAALLEADVAVPVINGFVERIREAAVGVQASKALSPGQQVIKAVNAELVRALGGDGFKITFASRPPTVILLAGLQGAGKTTTAAKLALYFRRQGRSPFLIAADLQRPAAVEQLRLLGEKASVPVYSAPTDPVSVAKSGIEEAKRVGRDVVIIDTAGRLAVDEALMDEISSISEGVSPHYTMLVVDAMMGQDSVRTATAFHERLSLDAVIMSKLDGDARGGAALSVKEVVGKPIAFGSTGEKLEDFDLFYPDRMANRILGMGDVLSLIEQAERTIDEEVAKKGAARLMGGQFDLDDFLEQLRQVRKMGPLKGLMGMLPGIPRELKGVDIDEKEIGRIEAIISSMTVAERRNPKLIDGSRRQRIAVGSGVSTAQVSGLLKQFGEMQKMVKSMGIGPASATKKQRVKASQKKGRRNKR